MRRHYVLPACFQDQKPPSTANQAKVKKMFEQSLTKRIAARLAMSAVAAIFVGNQAYGQSATDLPNSTAASPDSARPLESTPVNSTDERIRLLEQIKAMQEKLQYELKDKMAPATGEPAAIDAGLAKVPGAPALTADDDLEKIKQRLEVMRSLLKAKANPANPATASTDSAMVTPPATADTTKIINSEPSTFANPTQVRPTENVPPTDLRTTPETLNAESTATRSVMPGMPESLPLLDEPADIFELANCAFDVGEIDFALRLYDSPELKLQDPNDLSWRDYFVAGCLRVQGKFPEAEAAYRNVVKANKDSRAGTSATWWLNYMKSKQELNGAMQELQAQLDHYKTLRQSGGK